MNGQQATAAIYEKKQVVTTAVLYDTQVKNALLDYQLRLKDVGNVELLEFCTGEILRLNKLYAPLVATPTTTP